MVVSIAPHLRESYRLWRRFSLPIEGGTRDAYSVPNYVANQLISAYTIMVTSMVMNLWCIFFAIAFYMMLKKRDKPHIVSTSLWNKRASLTDSFLELIQPSTIGKDHKKYWTQWWIYPIIFVVVICWIAQNVLSIIVPPYILIGNGAPVNPNAIFAPSDLDRSQAVQAKVFSLDVPSALRAVGSAQVASKDVLNKATVSQSLLDKLPNGESILQVDYSYTVTGADFGLQNYPTLLLSVTGACMTEYNWLISSKQEDMGYMNDTYAIFGNISTPLSLNIFDGPAPIGYFYPGPAAPGGPPGNRTWAAFISSVDRTSFTPGTDPIYATTPLDDTAANTGYVVKPKRPALSCWQRDEWIYNGQSTIITDLDPTHVPGLDLSSGMQNILARYLGGQKLVDIGRQLGLSNLLSSTTSLGNIFDAGSSSAFSDLHRLILAAYIATTNTLTDLTLYPPNTADGTVSIANLALDDNGNPKPGVGDFVIWSTDISTLSIKALIIIPVLSLVFWLIALGLLTWSPLKHVNRLDATELHRTLEEKYPEWRLHVGKRESGRIRMFLPLQDYSAQHLEHRGHKTDDAGVLPVIVPVQRGIGQIEMGNDAEAQTNGATATNGKEPEVTSKQISQFAARVEETAKEERA